MMRSQQVHARRKRRRGRIKHSAEYAILGILGRKIALKVWHMLPNGARVEETMMIRQGDIKLRVNGYDLPLTSVGEVEFRDEEE
jgi:hypothetical protein